MGRKKCLSVEEELALAAQAIAGDDEARNQVVMNMVPMLYREAIRIGRNIPSDPDDLVNVGVAHILKSFHGFNPALGFRASTYFLRGTVTIMLREARETLIHTPKSGSTAQGGKEAEARARKCLSLHMVTAVDEFGEQTELLRILGDGKAADVCEDASEREEIAKVRQAVRRLRPRHQRVLEERMRGRSLQQVGRIIGCGKERVRQIQAVVIEDLQRLLGVKQKSKPPKKRRRTKVLPA